MARASPYLRVQLLGSLHIESDSHSIDLSTRKIESLLAYLALFPEPHSREKLAALLWGDSTDEQARLSLRVALSTLRKELGDDILCANRETIQLDPTKSIWIDAREGFRPSSIPEHELAHALGLMGHFPGFTGIEGVSLESLVTLTALYRVPPGTDMSQLCAPR